MLSDLHKLVHLSRFIVGIHGNILQVLSDNNALICVATGGNVLVMLFFNIFSGNNVFK